ncbi:sensor histidine kinase [Chitinophaga rhizosphaerae]|uniref:sensor histidine kinase n=1 Tax=Chitinophaga rhizosphaerae TaxID=1864947 RepID=UPI000F80AD1F|nr:histidine kinase [Chitinophaga rhizosphaerae]
MKAFLRKYAVRIAVTFMFVVIAWTIRQGIVPDMTIGRHLLTSIPVIIVTQFVWTVLSGVHKLLDKVFPFTKSDAGRIFLQIVLGTILIYVIRSIVFSIIQSNFKIEIDQLTSAMIATINNFVSITINLALIGQYYTNRWREGILKEERLVREKMQLQFLHLKNQVDPHFLFNAFTSLDSLVHSNPDLASQFIRHLSKVYRYALQNRDKDMVSLQTELEMLHHYIALQKIRFGTALVVDIELDASLMDRRIAAVTLQMLMDNAIKHNEIHADHPLRIRIYEQDDYIIVSNNKQIRKQLAASDKQGLEQLKQLYTFLSARQVRVEDGVAEFTVALPLS